MADYTSILNKTIAKLATNNAATRAVVYGKARAAIDRQLRAIQPTPSEEAIARQMQLLEEAIGSVEAEQSALEAATPVFAPVSDPALDPVPFDPVPLAPEAHSDAGPSLDGTANPAPPEMPANIAAAQVSAPPEEPSVVSPSVSLQDYPEPAALPESEADLDPPMHDFAQESEGSRGGFGKLIALGMLLLIIGGGAYALWINKDALMEQTQVAETAGSDDMAQDASSDAPAVEDPASNEASDENTVADDGPKDDVRLGADGETLDPPPLEQPDVSEPVNTASDVQTADNDGVAGAQAPVEVAEVGGSDDASSSDQSADSDASAAENANGLPAGAPAFAQKAFLYEEGGGGQGAKRSNGAVVWSLVQESPGAGLPEEPVIRGQLDVPEKGMTMTLAIKRNTDSGLPASHIIELLFSTPADFGGGNVEDIARFVMKSTEQARGEGLIAVPARIDAGFFLIALNNLQQAVETNSKLLLESNWIDVPMAYATGRRALVTLEKGAIGDKVFKEAFADWQNR